MTSRPLKWIRGVATLSSRDRAVLASALVLNPFMRFTLRTRGSQSAAGFVLDRSARRFEQRRRAADQAVVVEAKGVGAMVNRAAADPAPAVTCLARSLTAQLLLRRRGIDAELRIGVRPNDDPAQSGRDEPMLFHAWVEVDGIPVNDHLDVNDRYAVFPLGTSHLAGIR